MALILLSGCSLFKDKRGSFLERPNLPTEQTLGRDWLGGQHQSYGMGHALETLPESQKAGGILDFTFGESMDAPKLILSSGKIQHFRVHFVNGPGCRNKQSGPYEYCAGKDINSFNQAVVNRDQNILNKFRNRVKLYCDLMNDHPGVRFYFSWVLEHNLSVAAWNVFDEEGRKACPRNDYYVVNNPVGGHNFPQYPREGVLFESHGANPSGGQITSLDGEEVTDINVDNWLARTKGYGLVLSWSRADNCRPVEPFIDPRQRPVHACPSRDLHNQLNHITEPRPAAPALAGGVCASVQPFNSPYIWKPLAENYGHNDPRGNKPVAIVKFSGGNLDVVASNGKVVGNLKYYGAYQNGLHRFYSGMPGASNVHGYQFEEAAVKASGSPWVWLKHGNQCVGPLIPGRRAGQTRG